MKEKYIKRLSEYGKLGGYRCCPVDDKDVEEVKKSFQLMTTIISLSKTVKYG